MIGKLEEAKSVADHEGVQGVHTPHFKIFYENEILWSQ